MHVMMSSANSPVAPGIIRHLQNIGHYVIGHDCNPYGVGAALCDEFIVSPNVEQHTESYFKFLLHREFGVYLPFLDEELRTFAEYGLDLACSPPKTMKIFTSKLRQQVAMEDKGLPIAPSSVSGDVIAKPEWGRGGKGIIRTSFPVLIDALIDTGYAVQRFIEGEEYTVDILCDVEGQFLYAVPRKRIQVSGGVSTVSQVDMNPEIIDLARRLTNAFDFVGPINMQVIRDKKGQLHIIEVNPRLSGSCMFTVMAGFDILDASIRVFEGKPVTRPLSIKETVMARRYTEVYL